MGRDGGNKQREMHGVHGEFLLSPSLHGAQSMDGQICLWSDVPGHESVRVGGA